VDEKYTAILAGTISDPNYWMRWPQLPGEILRTRTAEGAKAILALAVDPNADLPQVHADAGVRAIRDLLKSPNPGMRADIQFWITQVYNQPGRPLRADDFPSTFREDPLVRKQANLKRLSTRY
jgi:hypothetical protein